MADPSDALSGPEGELYGELAGLLGSGASYGSIIAMLNQLGSGYSSLPGAQNVSATPVGPTGVAGVSEDPTYAAAEQQLLGELEQEANGGLNASDKANLEQAKLSALSAARGAQGADAQNLRNRGLYSSGAALSSNLAAQQGGLNANYLGDIQAAAAASQRQQAATTQAASMASNLGTRSLQQGDLAAQAQDRINQFNAQEKQQSDYYDSDLAQKNALAKLQGQGGIDAALASVFGGIGGSAAKIGGGLGRQIGDLLGTKGGTGNPVSGGTDPNGIGAAAEAAGVNPETTGDSGSLMDAINSQSTNPEDALGMLDGGDGSDALASLGGDGADALGDLGEDAGSSLDDLLSALG